MSGNRALKHPSNGSILEGPGHRTQMLISTDASVNREESLGYAKRWLNEYSETNEVNGILYLDLHDERTGDVAISKSGVIRLFHPSAAKILGLEPGWHIVDLE